jgi:hypothetical protein
VKRYDFKKAVALIEREKDQISEASLGMYEDWFWSAETVFEKGEFCKELNDDTVIGGIQGSSWATPSIRIEYTDGREECIPCYTGESTTYQPPYPNLGVLSGPVQANMPALNFKKEAN